MAAPVPTSWRVPPEGEMDAGLPVFGRTLTTLAGALNHLQGWQCRGFATADVWQGEQITPGDSDDVGYITGQPEAHGLVIVPYIVPIGVDWIHLVMTVLSVPLADGGATTPIVTVTVETPSGVTIDDGCEWLRSDGSLPGLSHWTRQKTRFLLPQRIESSGTMPGDPTPGVVSTPRRLYVGSEQGDPAIIRIVSERARVTGVHIIPSPLVVL